MVIGAFASNALAIFNAQAQGMAAQKSADALAMRITPLKFQINPGAATPATAPPAPAPVGVSRPITAAAAGPAAPGMSTTTIAAIAGGVALLGVVALVVLKKKKR